MIDFKWTYEEDGDSHICEMPEATLVARMRARHDFVWEVIVDKDDIYAITSGTTSISIDYAQGQAEGAYMGLKATGQI